MADGRDVVDYFVAGELAALAGLGPLSHLDLQLAGGGEVVRRDAESSGSDLLNCTVVGASVDGPVAPVLFAALPGITLTADAVHAFRYGAVGLRTKGAQRHGSGHETLSNAFD